MPRPFTPHVRAEISELRRDYCALNIVAEGVKNAAVDPARDEIVKSVRCTNTWPAWGDARIEASRAAYRGFGAKPQRTPSSVEALARRIQDGGQLPTINAVVDLYNALLEAGDLLAETLRKMSPGAAISSTISDAPT